MQASNSSRRASSSQRLLGRDEPIIDPGIEIVDAHHHLIDRPGLRYGVDDYLADVGAGHRIVASVYVETMASAWTHGLEPLKSLGEVEFANAVADRHGGAEGGCRVCAAIVRHADMRHGDKVGALLDRAIEIAPLRIRGVRQVAIEDSSPAPYRFIPNRPPSGLMRSTMFRSAFAQLEARELSFDAAVFHHQLRDVMDIADAFPGVSIVLNHCGHAMLMGMDEAQRASVFGDYRRLLQDLARRSNVSCKVGGLGMPFWVFGFEERSDPVGYLELAAAWHPYVETTIEAFGPDRCMMKSNYPPDSRSAGFVPLWNALKHIVRAASPEDKAKLFKGTATRTYCLA